MLTILRVGETNSRRKGVPKAGKSVRNSPRSLCLGVPQDTELHHHDIYAEGLG